VGEANAKLLLCEAHLTLGLAKDAKWHGKEALVLYRAAGCRAKEASVQLLLSQVFVETEDFEDAITAAEEASSLFREIGYKLGEAEASLAIANGLLSKLAPMLNGKEARESSDTMQAIKEVALQSADEATIMFRELGKKSMEAASMHAAANIHFVMENAKDALVVAKKALEIFSDLGEERHEALEMLSLAGIYLGLSEFELGKKSATAAKLLFQELDDGPGWDAATEVLEAILAKSALVRSG